MDVCDNLVALPSNNVVLRFAFAFEWTCVSCSSFTVYLILSRLRSRSALRVYPTVPTLRVNRRLQVRRRHGAGVRRSWRRSQEEPLQQGELGASNAARTGQKWPGSQRARRPGGAREPGLQKRDWRKDCAFGIMMAGFWTTTK